MGQLEIDATSIKKLYTSEKMLLNTFFFVEHLYATLNNVWKKSYTLMKKCYKLLVIEYYCIFLKDYLL